MTQFNEQFSTFTHQFAAAASRANRLALESAETVFGVQLKTFEKNVDATTAFFGELAEVNDLESYKALWPKGLQVAKDNAERFVAAGQEVFGLSLKTGEAFGQLVKTQVETATDNVRPPWPRRPRLPRPSNQSAPRNTQICATLPPNRANRPGQLPPAAGPFLCAPFGIPKDDHDSRYVMPGRKAVACRRPTSARVRP